MNFFALPARVMNFALALNSKPFYSSRLLGHFAGS
jgi:hypothetical protein